MTSKLSESYQPAAQIAGNGGSTTSNMVTLTLDAMPPVSAGRLYRPIKQQITARIDADVLAWLQSGGAGYQSRMNAILRRAMLDEMRTSR